jgi:NAD(P)-dependent dehydrogenase (short-subunit alcohol dehydrogenase family)
MAGERATGSFDFSGRRVLVTGASHGIGFAVARAFAGAGALARIQTRKSPDTVHRP